MLLKAAGWDVSVPTPFFRSGAMKKCTYATIEGHLYSNEIQDASFWTD